MSRERFDPDDPREWLNRARSNLIQASQRHPDVYLEDLCFQAQQSAEKAMKSVLLFTDVSFPYTHDLTRLLTLVQEAGISLPDNATNAVELNQYAVVTRYPGVAEEVTEAEYEFALEIAARIVDWAESFVLRNREK